MPSDPTAMVVTAAGWVAAVAGGFVALALARANRRVAASLAALVAAGVVAGGDTASAARPHPKPRLSVDWPSPRPAGVHVVVVRPGDCLWSITARHLDDPSALRVAHRWPRWWRRNRAVIGPNPDLIRPGQRLRPPGQP